MPLKIIYQPTQVSPTLGVEFAHRAYLAALAGFLVVALFMMLYYRLPGVLSALALVIYAIIVLAVYKAIPVTLTLAGVAGFIVSLGMAVDANVLIFERMKEELRAGRTLKAAVETGFNRAWPAIRDSNVTTWIACGILYWFGSSIPSATIVMGFALTLAIGVAVSMFSAITVTRTFLLLFTGSWATKRLTWFGVEAKSAVETKDV
jgi:preprotein translocase subunit SecD